MSKKIANLLNIMQNEGDVLKKYIRSLDRTAKVVAKEFDVDYTYLPRLYKMAVLPVSMKKKAVEVFGKDIWAESDALKASIPADTLRAIAEKERLDSLIEKKYDKKTDDVARAEREIRLLEEVRVLREMNDKLLAALAGRGTPIPDELKNQKP